LPIKVAGGRWFAALGLQIRNIHSTRDSSEIRMSGLRMDDAGSAQQRSRMKILGTGHALPRLAVDAAALDAKLQLAPGTALARNGVRRRAFVSAGETASGLAAEALGHALGVAELKVDDLDALLFAGVMSEQPMPPTAIAILRHLGGRSDAAITCMDVNASCLGFLRALQIAGDAIAVGRWRRVGVVAADLASLGLNWSDLDTATLFGDGAGAAVVGLAEAGETSRIIGAHTVTLSDGYELSGIRAGGSRYNVRVPPPGPEDYLFHMNGRGLMRLLSDRFPAFLEACLARADGAVDIVVPHQASATALAFLRRLLARNSKATVVDILAEHGNQVAASLPTALDIAVRTQVLARGQTVLLIGAAAGVTLGGLLLRY
jgi:3-oxoacyl-[acyl-carrier-protein] synthase-3